MSDKPDVWDEDMRALLRSEAGAERVPPSARRRLRKRLGISVLASALTGTAAAGAPSGMRIAVAFFAKPAAMVTLWAAVGAGAGAALLSVADPYSRPNTLAGSAPTTERAGTGESVAQATAVQHTLEPPDEPHGAAGSQEPDLVADLPTIGVTNDAARSETSAPRSSGRRANGAVGPNDGSAADVATAAPGPVTDGLAARPNGAGRDLDLSSERRLLESARSDISERRFVDALQKIERHARDYPAGRLAPEREALAVQALVGAGRYEEARRRGESFSQHFPQSMFRQAVDAVLRSIQ